MTEHYKYVEGKGLRRMTWRDDACELIYFMQDAIIGFGFGALVGAGLAAIGFLRGWW